MKLRRGEGTRQKFRRAPKPVRANRADLETMFWNAPTRTASIGAIPLPVGATVEGFFDFVNLSSFFGRQKLDEKDY